MDNQSDDRDQDRRPGGTPGELEEALKWLEELTARQGKPAELTNPVPAASLDSPFRGLIDSDEGDLPDWLRELPAPSSAQGIDETEPESRLDWLAKMAQRESIEELPTLEWRRLSEPTQSAILGERKLTESQAGDQTAKEPEAVMAETVSDVVPGEITTLDLVEPAPEVVEEIAELPAEDAGAEEPEEGLVEIETAALVDIAAGEPPLETVEVETEAPLAVDVDEFSLSEGEDNLPPLDDLDAAMAWIEELAASQDAPIEDLPSVADRALASKLMVEAGLNPNISPLDELGSDSSLVESLTPTHPFIEEEDFADTVVLVETLVADQGMETAAADSIEPTGDPGAALGDDAGDIDRAVETTVPGETTFFEEPPAELSFEEAMAYLDEMAVAEPEATIEAGLEPVEARIDEAEAETAPAVEEGFVAAVIVDVVTEEEAVEAPESEGVVDGGAIVIDDAGEWSPPEEPEALETEWLAEAPEPETPTDEFAPWLEESDGVEAVEAGGLYDETDSVQGAVVAGAVNGRGYSDLEVALMSLDVMALPPGKSLLDIDSTLRVAQIAPWRDVNSALDWLEATLTVESPAAEPAAVLDEESLIDQMPEDPDAVLAWLEQMAGEEGSPETAVPTYEQPTMAVPGPVRSEPLVEEMAEADLMNMPEDPDEAMAWLEGLARDSRPASSGVTTANLEPVEAYQPDIPATPEVDVNVLADEIAVDLPSEPVLVEPLVEPFAETPVAEQATDELPPAEALVIVVEETEIEQIEPELQPVAQPRKTGSKRRRSRAAAPEADAAQQVDEAPDAPPAAAEEPPALSWIDLLKPLD